MLYQSNERRHRLRSYGQTQTFYSQAANSSFYNAAPGQGGGSGQLPVDLTNSIDTHKSKESNRKSLPNSPNASNPNLLDQHYKQPKQSISSSRLSPGGQTPIKVNLNESVSSTNLNNTVNLSALSPSKSQTLKLGWRASRTEPADARQSSESLQSNRPSSRPTAKDYPPTDRTSNQSLNQPLNPSSRNNSGASYTAYPSLLNTSSSFNRSCRVNNMNCDRTTRMMLAILILFLITELPSGIINLLSGILGE